MKKFRLGIMGFCTISIFIILSFYLQSNTIAEEYNTTDEYETDEYEPTDEYDETDEYYETGEYDTENRPMPARIIKTGDIEFVVLKKRTFMIGSDKNKGNQDEHPKHKVTISSFMISKYEITQGQYKKIMGKNPSWNKGNDSMPVESVSWTAAMEFCAKFNEKHKAKARLPYEAEWEYACRAGTKTKYYWGNKINEDYVWYSKNSGKKLHPVGEKKPNDWGLYDMSGNVCEWCMDWYDRDYYSKKNIKDPKGAPSGDSRVLRGGSWDDKENKLRSASRHKNWPAFGNFTIGFRLVIPGKPKGSR